MTDLRDVPAPASGRVAGEPSERSALELDRLLLGVEEEKAQRVLKAELTELRTGEREAAAKILTGLVQR